MADKVHPRDTAEAMAVRLALIEERNVRADRNTAWELSWFRRFLLAMLVYALAALVLLLIRAENALIAAAVPPIGYLLVAVLLPMLKKWWIRSCYQN